MSEKLYKLRTERDPLGITSNVVYKYKDGKMCPRIYLDEDFGDIILLAQEIKEEDIEDAYLEVEGE